MSLIKEQASEHIVRWLRQTFEMKPDGTSYPKSLVYQEYVTHCEQHSMKPTTAAAFGKLMRMAFPGLQCRRKGPRGEAKHHYKDFGPQRLTFTATATSSSPSSTSSSASASISSSLPSTPSSSTSLIPMDAFSQLPHPSSNRRASFPSLTASPERPRQTHYHRQQFQSQGNFHVYNPEPVQRASHPDLSLLRFSPISPSQNIERFSQLESRTVGAFPIRHPSMINPVGEPTAAGEAGGGGHRIPIAQILSKEERPKRKRKPEMESEDTEVIAYIMECRAATPTPMNSAKEEEGKGDEEGEEEEEEESRDVHTAQRYKFDKRGNLSQDRLKRDKSGRSSEKRFRQSDDSSDSGPDDGIHLSTQPSSSTYFQSGFEEEMAAGWKEQGEHSGDICKLQSNPRPRDVLPRVVDWINETFETSTSLDAVLPKKFVYQQYVNHCNDNGLPPTNSATFGKILRSVFPHLKTRRLGSRGHTKHHYHGIRLRGAEPIATATTTTSSSVLFHPIVPAPSMQTNSSHPPAFSPLFSALSQHQFSNVGSDPSTSSSSSSSCSPVSSPLPPTHSPPSLPLLPSIDQAIGSHHSFSVDRRLFASGVLTPPRLDSSLAPPITPSTETSSPFHPQYHHRHPHQQQHPQPRQSTDRPPQGNEFLLQRSASSSPLPRRSEWL
ncbi:Transcription factor rfx3 [Balamuthia mandrillaris]